MSDHPLPRFSPARCRPDRVALPPPLRRLEAWARSGVTAPPLLAGGRVFLSLHEGALAAFDEATAAPLWRHRSPGPHLPSGDGSCVLVAGAPLLYHQGSLTELDPADGQVRSTMPVPGIYSSSMLPDGRRLYASFLDGGERYFGAFDLDARALLWKHPCRSLQVGRPALGAGLVCFRDGDASLCAVDAASGALRWSFSVEELGRYSDVLREVHGGSTGATFPIVGEQVIVPVVGHHLLSLDLASGEQRWLRRLASVDPSSLAADPDGRLHVMAHGRYHVVDAASGEELADFELKAELQRLGAGPDYTDPDVSESHIYVGSNRTLLALDKARGTIDWTFSCAHEIPLGNAPVIAGGRLYLVDYQRGSHSGDLTVLAPEPPAG